MRNGVIISQGGLQETNRLCNRKRTKKDTREEMIKGVGFVKTPHLVFLSKFNQNHIFIENLCCHFKI